MSSFRVLNVGFSNVVVTSKVLAILTADSSSSKRLRQEAKSSGKLLDSTHGRKTRSLVVTDSGFIVLSSIRVESLTKRIESEDNSFGQEDEEKEDEE